MPNSTTIRGFFIDPANNIAEERTIKKSLDGYYSLLNCDTITCASRYVGDRHHAYDIICDDEGLFKDITYPSAIDMDGSVVLVGAIFVVKFDGTDDWTSIDDADVEHLRDNLRSVFTVDGHYMRVLSNVAY